MFQIGVETIYINLMQSQDVWKKTMKFYIEYKNLPLGGTPKIKIELIKVWNILLGQQWDG